MIGIINKFNENISQENCDRVKWFPHCFNFNQLLKTPVSLWSLLLIGETTDTTVRLVSEDLRLVGLEFELIQEEVN